MPRLILERDESILDRRPQGKRQNKLILSPNFGHRSKQRGKAQTHPG